MCRRFSSVIVARVTRSPMRNASAMLPPRVTLPILAPGGVASALTHWGSADQQATYLKEFAGENVPQACVAIAEPRPVHHPVPHGARKGRLDEGRGGLRAAERDVLTQEPQGHRRERGRQPVEGRRRVDGLGPRERDAALGHPALAAAVDPVGEDGLDDLVAEFVQTRLGFRFAAVSDYATASMRLTVPENQSCVATGTPASGWSGGPSTTRTGSASSTWAARSRT